VKQLLLGDAYSDIAQKHHAPKFIFTIDRRGQWNRNDGEAEMAKVAFTCSSKILEQTVEMRENKAHSLRRIAQLHGLWRRACVALAEWDSRALQRERLAQLNDRLLADVGLVREKQIVDRSKLFYWFP
jgi:uncharacterized protein YjiS (DUF1127 family)